ncbi:MAG TPA: YgcG family protein [Roseiarcus sp.]
MLRLWPRALIAALVAALWVGAALAAANFPPLTGRVVDQAKILSPVTAADLESKLAALEQKSGIQLVVATVPSLGGEEIEPYANELFRAWKLGEAKKNNGALLLIAPNERRMRIEVGYGLEGTLTDAVSSIIISNAIAPRFKAGDFNGGVSRGVDDIITALTTDSAEWKPKPTDMRAEPEASLLDTLAPFLIFLFIMFVISRISRRSGGGNVIFIPMGTGGFGGGFRGGGGFGGGGFGGGGFSGGGGSSGGGGASGGW